MSLAWCASNPDVSTVILGASKPEQLKESLKAVDVIPMMNHSLKEDIDMIMQNKPKLAEY
jgi:aryl-alcohol dehydrogenase-like predicted oxidoreductase